MEDDHENLMETGPTQPGTSTPASEGTSDSSPSSDDISVVDKAHIKGKKSWVWEYCGMAKMKEVVDMKKTICKLCHKKGKTVLMPYSGNTSTMSYHLNAVH